MGVAKLDELWQIEPRDLTSQSPLLGEAKRAAGVKKYINPKGLGVLKALDEVSKKHNVDNTQVTLAWLLQRKSITAPIVSATSTEQLADTLKAATLKLSDEDLAELTEASAY